MDLYIHKVKFEDLHSCVLPFVPVPKNISSCSLGSPSVLDVTGGVFETTGQKELLIIARNCKKTSSCQLCTRTQPDYLTGRLTINQALCSAS